MNGIEEKPDAEPRRVGEEYVVLWSVLTTLAAIPLAVAAPFFLLFLPVAIAIPVGIAVVAIERGGLGSDARRAGMTRLIVAPPVVLMTAATVGWLLASTRPSSLMDDPFYKYAASMFSLVVWGLVLLVAPRPPRDAR